MKVGEGFVDLFLSVHHEGTTEHDGSRKGLPAKSRRCVAPPLAIIVTTKGSSSPDCPQSVIDPLQELH